ncbi:hypothetical protein J1N35_011292 [Gossypium stocksii]|uniref:Piwi domain-containing protein n=1 Tax=Gossypium stocksii TaxID=47602 RepID=A0A9D3W268_9ROSI|nr:hypothetical protein J1N35_011292 [Gossypium stocksii]
MMNKGLDQVIEACKHLDENWNPKFVAIIKNHDTKFSSRDLLTMCYLVLSLKQTDNLQKLVHSLSYEYQRSTTAISVVAPICYTHLAASQLGQFIKFVDASETSSSHGRVTTPRALYVPQLSRLKDNVSNFIVEFVKRQPGLLLGQFLSHRFMNQDLFLQASMESRIEYHK